MYGNNTVNTVKKPKVTYFYKQQCPFSKMTHPVITRQFGGNGEIEAVCVDGNPSFYKKSLSKFCRKEITTFPQIFINNIHVGGYADLERFLLNREVLSP